MACENASRGDYRLAGDWTFSSKAFFFDGTSWIGLGTLGGNGSYGWGLNDSGEVVGQSETATATECFPIGGGAEFCLYENHAFRWRNGVMHDLDTVGSESVAYGINNAGLIAGTGGSFAQRWVQGGQIDVFGTFGGTCHFSWGSAINSHGQVVGYASTDGAWSHAFVWDPRTGLVDLGTLGGPNSYAIAISEAGHVVGVSETATTTSCTTNQYGTYCIHERHPFLWKDGEMIDIGTLGGPDGTPRGVNSRGEVAGDSDTSELLRCSVEGGLTYCNYLVHAFVWSDGTMVDLGEPELRSFATGINERSDIVGVASQSAFVSRPVIWRRR